MNKVKTKYILQIKIELGLRDKEFLIYKYNTLFNVHDTFVKHKKEIAVKILLAYSPKKSA